MLENRISPWRTVNFAQIYRALSVFKITYQVLIKLGMTEMLLQKISSLVYTEVIFYGIQAENSEISKYSYPYLKW